MKTVFPLLAMCLAMPVAAQENGDPFYPVGDEVGQASFLVHCASCHGDDAKGDGPMAADLRVPPADLTRLAANNGGQFPFGDVIHTIDGRIPIKGHGGTMPVFGALFAKDFNPDLAPFIGEEIVRGRILALTYYLESIQELDG